MGEMDGILYGTTQDWSILDMGEIARQATADDEAFDGWLASLSPDTFDRVLGDLYHEAEALFNRTA